MSSSLFGDKTPQYSLLSEKLSSDGEKSPFDTTFDASSPLNLNAENSAQNWNRQQTNLSQVSKNYLDPTTENAGAQPQQGKFLGLYNTNFNGAAYAPDPNATEQPSTGQTFSFSRSGATNNGFKSNFWAADMGDSQAQSNPFFNAEMGSGSFAPASDRRTVGRVLHPDRYGNYDPEGYVY